MLAPRPTKLRSQRDINLWRIPLQLSLAAVALFGITLVPDILDKLSVIHIPSWLTMGSIDDARAILSAMMGAVATVLALIFSVALLVPVGASMMVQMASSNTLIQAMVPDALRGRVMAVYSMMFMGMAPFGALFAGAVAERLGAPRTVAFGGLVTIAAAAVFSQRLPSLRGEARQLIIAQGLAGGDPPGEIMIQR